LQYIQVLIGLFCNESQKGSYSPDEFKKTISELNPLFQGVQANDSKDLVIFLLEAMNNELVKIHNKKKNIIEKENEAYQIIDSSDEKKVLEYFIHNFKKTHCSIIGDYLCGFNKSVFICQNCSRITYNFNIFNLLIFSLEATSNYFNLSYNNSAIPTINFDYCFKYMSKEELFQDTYCQHCGKTGLSKYRETIFSLPQYLIIILNRGRGNVFNCNVQIPEIFDASNYIEIKSQNNNYELVGIVSHFGESGMSGHFIAFCKHNIDGKWRCYNDSIVTECENDYLKKGTPYIVFYKKCQNEKMDINALLKNQEINNRNNNSYNNQNINPSNNMFLNNISNNNNINQNMIMNNNYNQPNMIMNNNYNQPNMMMNNNYNQPNMMMNNNYNQPNMMMNNNINIAMNPQNIYINK
jgi:ubiquitin C-terminal hydrolase